MIATGDLDAAQSELKSLSRQYPSSAAVHVHLGVLHAKRQDTAAAERAFERALELAPRDVEALGQTRGSTATPQRRGVLSRKHSESKRTSRAPQRRDRPCPRFLGK